MASSNSSTVLDSFITSSSYTYACGVVVTRGVVVEPGGVRGGGVSNLT